MDELSSGGDGNDDGDDVFGLGAVRRNDDGMYS